MDKWQGIHDDDASVGDDQIALIVGVTFRVIGELGRRPGLTGAAQFGGNSLGAFVSPQSGTWLLIVRSTGAIEAQAL